MSDAGWHEHIGMHYSPSLDALSRHCICIMTRGEIYRIYSRHKLSIYNLWQMKSRRGAAVEGFDPPKIVYAELVPAIFGQCWIWPAIYFTINQATIFYSVDSLKRVAREPRG